MKPGFRIACIVIVVIAYFDNPTEAKMSPREIYQNYAKAVVLIVSSPKDAASASAGSGSIIKKDGIVITNAHVIFNPKTNQPFEQISVFLKPKKVTGDPIQDLQHHHRAKVLVYDHALDLALLKIHNPPSGLTVITLGNSDDLGPGDETLAIGHPEQGGLWTITTGIIGAQFTNFRGIPGKHVFQIDTDLNRGNSGGPLFDTNGFQVGVNTSIARKGKGGVVITGVNFSIKSEVVINWTTQNASTLNTQNAKKPGKTTKHHKTTTRPSPNSYSLQTSTAKSIPKRPPLTQEKIVQIKSRPYQYKNLFRTVDHIKNNAEQAFDELEEEIENF